MATPETTAVAKPAEPKQLTRVQAQRLTLRTMFERQKPELRKLLPKGMDLDRLERMALTECIKKPELLECTMESWALAFQKCASQGLYPDSDLGFMYLIPRNNSKKVGNEWKKFNEVTAQRGYQGDIQLARNTGELADIYAVVVYAKDEYKVTMGLNRNIVHEPSEDEDPGPLRAVYAVAKLRSGEVAFVTLRKSDVMRHKKSAQGTDRADSPWNAHEAAMWMKTAIHELFKWLPKSSEKMEAAYKAIVGEGAPAIDVSAIGRTELALEPRAEGLGAVTERLEAEAAADENPAEATTEAPAASDEEPPPPGCSHPKVTEAVLAAVPADQLWPCDDCGEALQGTKPVEKPAAKVDTATCDHLPDAPPSRVEKLLKGKSLECSKCGTVFRGKVDPKAPAQRPLEE